ncbi:uncharacterized protein EI90DRAFT_3085936 [Cantharellus anzutake]|uniref:uncharacterized protein n=1 Tax=Cantharellus anzutake TaxID=1750568 RepID=UPI001903D11F|nr:uncharacterized protein EI90DRAFT_3085936 [Cantharellus anzutake]KAF8316935.1 hypothetical protein EI90DRAFT_3085936 [Cantharellus anzutake]
MMNDPLVKGPTTSPHPWPRAEIEQQGPHWNLIHAPGPGGDSIGRVFGPPRLWQKKFGRPPACQ